MKMLYSHLHKLDIKLYAIIFCARSTMYNMMLSNEYQYCHSIVEFMYRLYTCFYMFLVTACRSEVKNVLSLCH